MTPSFASRAKVSPLLHRLYYAAYYLSEKRFDTFPDGGPVAEKDYVGTARDDGQPAAVDHFCGSYYAVYVVVIIFIAAHDQGGAFDLGKGFFAEEIIVVESVEPGKALSPALGLGHQCFSIFK